MQHENAHTEKISLALSECAAWLTLLNLLKEESYSLKTNLSEALDNYTEKELVADAEIFHNLIIVRDEYIRDIATDIRKQERKLKEIITKNSADKQWIKLQQKLSNEIAHLEKDFKGMREDFYRKFYSKKPSDKA